jgi:DNA primase
MASIDEAKEIIKGTPISSIVSFYHPISKRGANFEGICPFHGDSHPSLKINDSKGIYKCFACGAAGDSIRFVQDKLNLSFIEAIKDIANQLGISIEEKLSKKSNPKYDMALRVLQAANKLYKKVAIERKPPQYQEFLKQRNINAESQTNFQIGYAPNSGALISYLESLSENDKTMAIQCALDIGLIRPNKRGQGHYDFYRDRVMFPVWDHSGKVRGFSSRAVLPDQVPKYLNSGESFIFDKGNILYGFNLAKNHIRESDSVIIVEGNMDALMLHQYGFKNSVATMGVALSQNSVQLLKNMAKTIYLAMDSDAAGLKAMARINNDFLRLKTIPRFIDFSPAKDPDEFLNQQGRLELQKRIEEAPTFTDYLINESIPKEIPEHTEKKLDILKEIFQILSPLETNLLAQEKIIQAAKTLGLRSSTEDVLSEYKSFLAGAPKTRPVSNAKSYKEPAPTQTQEDYKSPELKEEDQVQEKIVSSKPVSKAEKILLETLLTHPECILANQITEILDKIEHFEVKRIVQWLKTIYLEIDESEYSLFIQEKMKESMPDEVKSIMASSLFHHNSLKLEKKVIDKLVADLNKKMDENLLKNQRERLKVLQRQVNSDEEGLEILSKIQNIELELLALRNK